MLRSADGHEVALKASCARPQVQRDPAPANAHPKEDMTLANQLGKRYVSEDTGIEVLCTKGGTGEVACQGAPMKLMVPKALPSSD